MAKSKGLRQDVRRAMADARVERRRQAFSAILEGDAALAAEFADPTDLEILCRDAEQYRKVAARLANAGDIDELKKKRDAKKAEHLAAVAEEQKHFRQMKATLGRLISEHSGLCERVSNLEKDMRLMNDLRTAYDITITT
jgi:phage terminase small subunit